MSWKKTALAALICGLMISPALAQGPTVTVDGTDNGATTDWTVSFTPDGNLFNTTSQGTGGSIATEFSIEIADGTLNAGSVTVSGDFMETINGTPIVNPGNDPYIAAISTGITTHSSVAAVLGTGTVDAIFAPLGSTFFTSATSQLAISFTTTSADDVTFGGLAAQDGQVFTLATATASPTSGGIPADYNNSGLVGIGDLNLVLNNFGVNTPPVPAGWVNDLPDGVIEITELNNVLNNFGNTAGSLTGGAPVPEPASGLALLGLVAMMYVGKRR